jgi:hypothetical protein
MLDQNHAWLKALGTKALGTKYLAVIDARQD